MTSLNKLSISINNILTKKLKETLHTVVLFARNLSLIKDFNMNCKIVVQNIVIALTAIMKIKVAISNEICFL